MNKILRSIIVALLLIGVGSSVASAQSYYMHRQLQRIQEGIQSGELTRREASRLRIRVIHLQNFERAARRDGFLSWRERQYIEREREALNRAIYRQKHDWQDRDDRWWR
jgi:hypothetical protein